MAIKTCFMLFFFLKNQAIYEIMWKNVCSVGYAADMICHMCFACWITKATDRHSEYAILNGFP